MRTRTPTAHRVADGSPAAPLLLHRSENPWGASPKAVEAARAELLRVHRYPDPRHTALIDALSAHYRVTTDRVAVGNGVDEIIMLLALALRDTGRAVVNEATYQGYRKTLEAVGLRIVQVPLEHYRVGPAALREEMGKGAALVFVCNPHNPTGSVLDAGAVRSLCETARATGSHIVFDEAYAEFADDSFTSALPWAREGGGVSVLRTFSKAYGLASLRVGALIGCPDVVSRIETVQDAMPYHVNRLAQAAACAALEDQAFLEQTRIRTATARMALCSCLDRLGITYLPSQTNFVTVYLSGSAPEVTRQLLADHVHVRDATDMGMPGWIRISVGTPSDVLTLVRHLEAALASDH
ncbi:pyridoxal phosphate-dependent aminotransferase [Streptomyces capitiformicae]|uniref:histidinol-phosphate transaminase n=1 Tax=Streptomyces capitiformicae TaxID=2014920 RepID=A0A918ZQU1_9ACTN|nr:histidinol-phosphate transaminase [Streptomyces capitiformicae]GHE65902.1 histidinol-phosphate aminotransferase [Streptomyces capitiformicae]